MRTLVLGSIKVLIFAAVFLALTGSLFQFAAKLREQSAAQQLAPENGQFVATELGAIHVSLWGDANDPPVVMTHGMAAWGGLWEDTAKHLARNGYRVIAVDMPPFGFSQRDNKTFTRSAQAARVGALLKAMNLRDVRLVGHSYGGGVAMETALRHPDRIAGLVLVCPVLGITPPGQDVSPGVVPMPLRSTWLGEFVVSMTITNPLLTGFLTQRFMHNRGALTDRHIEILQRPMPLRGNTHNMVLWLQQFLVGDSNAKSRVAKNLQALSLPLALIWGDKDTVTPIAQGDQLAAIIEPVRFTRLKDIGHMPQLESPEFPNTLLTAISELAR